MPRIVVLSEEVVRKIAAGEVVDGPHSVVKELVENSIDAGATRIDISVEGGGILSMRVTDDGCGMEREDALLAFQRHATSKIRTAEDIFGIGSLGFRGEALPSIAAVASVTCTTRPDGAEVGTKVLAEGEVKDLEEVGCPVGTTIEVRDLFKDVPARKKYLKGAEKEFSRILDVVMSKALTRTDIRFRLSHNGKLVFQSPPAKDLIERVAAVYGLGVAKEMLKVSWEDHGVSIQGYASKPHVSRSRQSIHIIVNGRDVSHRSLNRAVVDGYGTLIPKGRYPVAVLWVDVAPDRVDVNVHPAKTEVRFEEELKVEGAIIEAVRKALSLGELIPPIELEDLDDLGIKGKARARAVATDPGPKARGQVQTTIDVDTGDMEVASSIRVDRPAAGGPELGPGEDVRARRMPSSIVIKGQAGSCYIIGETEEGLAIIDQHAAHEKVVFEELRRQLGSGRVDSQELLSPVTLELSVKEAEELVTLTEALEMLGFRVEPFGGRSCIVKSVPAVLGVTVEPGAVHDVMSDLERAGATAKGGRWKGVETLRSIGDKVLATMACHTSTRAGQALDLEDMKRIVRLLYEAEEPFNCPHGRPTIIFLPYDRLEKRFGRRT